MLQVKYSEAMTNKSTMFQRLEAVLLIQPPPGVIISKAKYSKNMILIQFTSNNGFKSSENSRLLRLGKPRYSHREHGYIISVPLTEKFLECDDN